MAVTSTRTVQIGFSGDVSSQQPFSALENTVSPGETIIQTLLIGNNTITAPVVSGLVVTGLTIIPPAGNVNKITLKGVNGDTGFPIHDTDPTSIGLNEDFVSLVLNAAAQIIGVRLIWS